MTAEAPVQRIAPDTLAFLDWLEALLASDPPKQKGQRTRERLRIATGRVLTERGYHSLRVIDVTDQAGVAEGLFYAYFKDKAEASLAVLESLLGDFYLQHLTAPMEASSRLEAIRSANRRWLALCRANAGLMRCVLQVGDEVPEFAGLVHRTNAEWYRRVADSVLRSSPQGAVAPQGVLLEVYMLGAMMDELTRRAIIAPAADMLALLETLGDPDTVLVDAASMVWLRTLYPGSQDEEAALAPGAAALLRPPRA